MGICRLCLQEKDLIKKSHIIPEFMYRDLFDENHKFIMTSNKDWTTSKFKKPNKPSGEYEGNILCSRCDNQILGKYETYASRALYGGAKLPVSENPRVTNHINQEGASFSRVKNIDYAKFKLFLLSILWKASISSRPFFEDVDLGPHEEVIGKMILTGDAGEEHDYPIQFLTYLNDESTPRDFIGQPRVHKTKGHRMTSFFIGGIFYGFVVSSHTKPEHTVTSTIKKNNELLMVHIPKGQGMRFIARYAGLI